MITALLDIDLNHEFFVYILCNPNDNIAKYVGITNSPKARLRKHLTSKTKTLKNNWIKSLISKGVSPKMIIIDSAESRDVINQKEKEWIEILDSRGYILKNMTKGGDGGNTFGGRKHTDSAKEKISIANSGRKRDLAYLNDAKRKRVEQICPDTKTTINVFDSVSQASSITGASKTNIAKFANGSIKSTIKKVGGYEWRYCN